MVAGIPGGRGGVAAVAAAAAAAAPRGVIGVAWRGLLAGALTALGLVSTGCAHSVPCFFDVSSEHCILRVKSIQSSL